MQSVKDVFEFPSEDVSLCSSVSSEPLWMDVDYFNEAMQSHDIFDTHSDVDNMHLMVSVFVKEISLGIWNGNIIDYQWMKLMVRRFDFVEPFMNINLAWAKDVNSEEHPYETIKNSWDAASVAVTRFRNTEPEFVKIYLVGPRCRSKAFKQSSLLYERVMQKHTDECDDEKRSTPLGALELQAEKANTLSEMCELAMQHVAMRHGGAAKRKIPS